ncbi:MAG TPA: ParB/RepB/Spo0J family partition protein [Levilinea sp.]|nr:ParB/RepB/Spo0J family partition protein [Levilinea sp.]
MARKGGLGKGLEALIPTDLPSETAGTAAYVPLSKVIPNPHQPRFAINDADLADLTSSIRSHGILQPLIVTQDFDNDRYVIIAGERRLRAARLAGLDSVPVILRQADDQQLLELALIENIQRADLTPLEMAEAYRQLHSDFHLSHEEIAMRVGKSRVTVTNTLRLLNLPEFARKALGEGRISEGHARALLGLTTPQAQVAALNTILKNDLTVRQAEELVRRLSGEKTVHSTKKPPPPEVAELEERLRNRLGTKVSLLHGKKGGRLTIHYYSDEELNAIIGAILQE